MTGEAMVLKVGRPAEGFAAAGATPRPLPSVGAVVLFQLQQPIEHLATHHTLKTLPFTPSTHLQWNLDTCVYILLCEINKLYSLGRINTLSSYILQY